jgi:succinoglycan biosynthesis protein ExoM
MTRGSIFRGVGMPPHITICICTYRRPALLERLLTKLVNQKTDDTFTYSVLVVDNDQTRSAESVVRAAMKVSPVEIVYLLEPTKGYSHARNRLMEQAKGDFLAFIDDDEFPGDDWLLSLLRTCRHFGAAGVLGPVRPRFTENPPKWLVKSKICEKPGYIIETGSILKANNTRTSNVILTDKIFKDKENRFDTKFSKTGGEDVDFFIRMIAKGYSFVWCEEAPVFETVSEERLKKKYYLRRALLQGSVDLSYFGQKTQFINKLPMVSKTVLAFLLYTILLPIFRLAGEHVYMKYLIKDCHHIGRLLAICGIRPVKGRDF